jgi:hypothetical protein
MSQKKPDIQHFVERLPAINDWIDHVTDERISEARLLGDLKLRYIQRWVSDKTLASIQVIVTDTPPRPPVAEFGFEGADHQLDQMALGAWDMRGATIDQLCFINSQFIHDEQYLFHQIVHSLQWKTLGREYWLKNYLYGVITCGRADTWAEKQAGRLQARFARMPALSWETEEVVTDELATLSHMDGWPYV